MNLPLKNPVLAEIRQQFQLERQAGRARHREIAEKLNISEGELIAAHIGAPADGLMRVSRLQPDWHALLKAFASLKQVMSLTRNAACVHEKDGVYSSVIEQANVVSVRGEQIDLQCRFAHWQHGFAVEESSEKGVQRSLQFYDAAGGAVHKVFLRPHSDVAAYLALVEQFSDKNQLPGITVQPFVAPTAIKDFPSFLVAWDMVHEARDLYTLLAHCGGACLSYVQQLAAEVAQQVPVNAARVLLETAATEAIAVLILTGNTGVTQAHSGLIDKVVVMGPWLNVLDPGFNLHLREDHIAFAWVVIQSGLHGLFSSLALLNEDGELITLFASVNVTDRPEANAWADLIERLPKV